MTAGRKYKPYSVVWDHNRQKWRLKHGYPTSPGTYAWYDDKAAALAEARRQNAAYEPPAYLRNPVTVIIVGGHRHDGKERNPVSKLRKANGQFKKGHGKVRKSTRRRSRR